MDETPMAYIPVAELERLKRIEWVAVQLAGRIRRTVDERPFKVAYGMELLAFDEELGYIEEEDN